MYRLFYIIEMKTTFQRINLQVRRLLYFLQHTCCHREIIPLGRVLLQNNYALLGLAKEILDVELE